MAYMTFETKQDWKDYQARIGDAMWGIFAKDAPEGGYWELFYFSNFLSRFYQYSTAQEIFHVWEKPYRWDGEYKIYKKFQKLVDGEIDSDTLHTMQIWNFAELERAMIEPNWAEIYMKNLSCW